MPDLDPLRDGPVPTLAPPSTVRARGDQRRRRARAAFAGTGVALVALAGVTGVALGDLTGRDALRPEPLASTAPVALEEPLQAALLDADDVVLDGSWQLRQTDDLPLDVVLSGCGHRPAQRAETAVRFLDGPQGSVVGERLAVHPDAAAATSSYAVQLSLLQACGEGSPTYRLLDEGRTETRTYGEVLDGEAAFPFSLERVGRTVVTLVLRGPREGSPELTDRAAEEVREVLGEQEPSPVPAQARVRPEQLLDAASVEAVAGKGWTASAPRDQAFPLTFPCPQAPPSAEDGRLVDLGGPTGRRLAHQVLAYADAAAAGAAFDRWVEELSRCPVRPQESEDGRGTAWHAGVTGLPGAGPTRSYALVTTQDCEDCPEFERSVVVSLVGDDVSYLSVVDPETNDLSALADAAEARVRGDMRAAPSKAPAATAAPPDVSTLLLTVADANAAEPGAWTRESQDVEGPLLDPCPGGTAYPRDGDRVDTAVTELVSRREAGGTSVVQTVARYRDEAAAQDAAEGYERAVRACPTKTDEGITATHEVLGTTTIDGVRTTLVRFSTTCPSECVGSYEYYAVQHRADVVSVLVVGYGEDGDPGVDVVRPFAREAAEHLA